MLEFNRDKTFNERRTLDVIEQACIAEWGERGWKALPPRFRAGEIALRVVWLLDHHSNDMVYRTVNGEVPIPRVGPAWATALLKLVQNELESMRP